MVCHFLIRIALFLLSHSSFIGTEQKDGGRFPIHGKGLFLQIPFSIFCGQLLDPITAVPQVTIVKM